MLPSSKQHLITNIILAGHPMVLIVWAKAYGKSMGTFPIWCYDTKGKQYASMGKSVYCTVRNCRDLVSISKSIWSGPLYHGWKGKLDWPAT